MKKNAIALLLFLLVCGSAYCQPAYKGQLRITNKELSVSSGKLHVSMAFGRVPDSNPCLASLRAESGTAFHPA